MNPWAYQFRLRLALHVAVITGVLSVITHAQDVRTAAVSNQNLQAKLAYCKTCHGSSGQGYHGAFPIPRLAGQQPEYIENQLKAFIDRRRANRFMYSVAHVLTPDFPTLAFLHALPVTVQRLRAMAHFPA